MKGTPQRSDVHCKGTPTSNKFCWGALRMEAVGTIEMKLLWAKSFQERIVLSNSFGKGCIVSCITSLFGCMWLFFWVPTQQQVGEPSPKSLPLSPLRFLMKIFVSLIFGECCSGGEVSPEKIPFPAFSLYPPPKQ